MHRKHIINTPRDKLNSIPFYCWNCITLQLPHRDVDLVIKCDVHMKMFIRFLVYTLKTIDGNKDSARGILDALLKQDLEAFSTKTGRVLISESRRHNFLQKNEYRIFRQINMKYTIMRIRMKISYMAFEKQVTLMELFLLAIREAKKSFEDEGLMEVDEQ